MKILILQDDFPLEVAGGAGIMAYRMAQNFVKRGHEILVVTATESSDRIDFFENIKVHRLHSKYHERWRSYFSLFNPFVFFKIKRMVKEFNPDIIHAHNVHHHISYASLLLGKKVVMTAHDIMPFYPGTFTEFIKTGTYKVNYKILFEKFKFRYNPFRNLFIKCILNKIKVVAVSHELKKALEENGIKNIEVIHNGIDLDWMEPSFSNKILFQGRLSGAKGGELILHVLKKVSDGHLLVIGKKDDYANRMLKRAENLGIDNRITFTGWLNNQEMKKAYSEVGVVVIPSVCFDSFPNGNLEAFASQKPVVSTCFGGSKEIVEDGVNGFIVNPFDIDIFAEKVNFLLENKEKAKEFGRNGYELVKREFTIDTMVEKYLAIF